MNFKEMIAKDLTAVLGEQLSYEDILNLIEKPKVSSHGDYSFPVFSLSKIQRKAPNVIAEELSKSTNKLHQWGDTSTSSLKNQK